MRLLILGGTVFLGHETARQAVAAGHEVTCAARGESGSVPAGARHVPVDLSQDGGLAGLDGESFDAVIDVGRRPSFVRRSLSALRDRVGHWTYVSSISAYVDEETPFQQAATAVLRDPGPAVIEDVDADPEENYPEMKRACELAVLDGYGPDRSFLCRAGLIVGPADPSDRFTYWPVRMARGGEVLAPGRPEDLVQYVDVRDLAAWLLAATEKRLSGAYDGTGAPVRFADFLAGVAAGVGVEPTLTWLDQEFLKSHEVNPWSGPRSLPMWLPMPEYGGFLSHDTSASVAAGLRTRDLTETSRDTRAWFEAAPYDLKCGLSPAEEAEVLAAWAAR